MFTQWATRRLCKFLLKKRLGRYIRGDLDLEQLEVQLGSGIVQLNDLALNTDYVNEQLADLPVALKEGSLGSVTLKLHWKVLAAIEIEVDEVELVLTPRKAAESLTSKNISLPFDDPTSANAGLDTEFDGLASSGGCTYLPVQEGVRVVANLVERLLLGMHVRIRHAILAFEELPSSSSGSMVDNDNNHVSHSMLIIRVGNAEYGVDSFSSPDGSCITKDTLGINSVVLTNAVRFQDMTMEVLDVQVDGSECPSCTVLGEKTGGGKVFGKPVPILLGDEGLSGCVQLSMPWKSGCLDIPKLNADISISHVNLKLTGNEIQRLLNVASSFGDGGNYHVANAQSCANQSGILNNNGLLVVKPTDDKKEMPSHACLVSDVALAGYQSKSFSPALLPVTRLISDWAHWDGGNNHENAVEAMSEADFAASTDEFFECFDGTRSSQASLSGSGLWTWTCSAFSAITAASSLASGSVLISQDSPKKVEYDFKFKIPGVSVIIVLEETPIINLNAAFGKPLGSVAGDDERDMHPHYRDGHLEVLVSDIDLSLQVSQGHLEFQVTVKWIEAFEVQSQLMQDVGLCSKQSALGIVEEICSSSQSFQALVENALPNFSVSLCAGMEACKSHLVTTQKECFSCEGSKSETVSALSDYRKKWVLRLSTLGNLAAINLILKQDFLSLDDKDKDPDSPIHTKLEVHLQPLIVWFDASIVVKVQKLVDIFTHPTSGSKSRVFSTKFDSHFHSATCASSRSVTNIDLFIPSLRILACLPHASGSSLMKDNLLCLDVCASENLKKPLLAAKLYDTLCNKQNPPHLVTLVLEDISAYLVSPSTNFERPTNHTPRAEDLAFCAHKILSFSEFNHKPVILELRLKGKSTGGAWLAERAWNAVVEQQKGGMGGSENGKMSCEFAAATATAVVDEKNCHMREHIQSSSSVCLHTTIPCVGFEVFGSQHLVVLGLISSIMDLLVLQNDRLRFQSSDVTLNSEGQGLSQMKDNDQISISIDIGKVEITCHPKLAETEARHTPQRAEDHPWGRLRIIANKLQLLYVLNLGMIKSASYLWVSHEDGLVEGLSAEANSLEMSLFTCRNDALGRGDGGGGNALATSSAGIEITVIAWPDGHHSEDTLISATLRGGTFVAHGGRLDWLPALITFFCQALDKDSTERAIHVKGFSPTAEVSLLRLEHSAAECEDVPSENCTFFSLDLHDVALCYEPGEEALLAANIRARRSAEAPASAMEFTPVACILAAAAVRVSSNAISSTRSKEYGIWLRDVALLLVDMTLRRRWLQDYTTDALHQAGYVKVAREAVMEAVVRINSDEGLQWEVECANNQLRLDTCHDTTAALGRLVAQLQQLFAPDIVHSTIPQQARTISKDVEACCAGECFTVMPEDVDNDMMSFSNLVNEGKNESMLGDTFTLVRDSSSNVDTSTNMSLSCDHVESETVSSELLGRFELLGRSGLSSDDAAEETHCSSLDHGSSDGQNQDFWAPLSENDGLPSFIEDYYVTKNSSLHSSRSSSCNDSGELLQHNPVYANEFGTLNTIEGSGGWYEGHTFKVVENHVPEVNNRSGSKKQRGSLSHPSNKRLGLATKYPRSVGRVALQGLNVRWRLYGGSDWTVAGVQDELGISHAHRGGRQLGVCLEVILDGVELQYDTFSETSSYASRLAVSIRDIRVFDCSKDAPWKKVLDYHRSKSRPRESSAQALKLELESVRPDPLVPLEEYRLSVHLLPMRLHLDQHHLDFFVNFFPPSPCSSPQLHESYEEIGVLKGSNLGTKGPEATSEEALLPFFQTCELQPFTIRVDYIPRRVDIAALRGGNYAELFNLVSWKGIELQLKHVHAAGVHGWGALSGIVVGEWLEDISRNQIHKLIRGLGPIRPLFAVGSGAAKLIVLPAEHYKRDRRRLLRGMRKGAIAFLRSISLEAVGLGVQLAAGAHEILRHTESALGAVALSGSLASDKGEMPSKVNQPGDMREGLQQACESISRGFERTASSLIGNPLKVYQRGSGTGLAVASALRAAPAAAVAPASAAAGAVHRALLGVRNSLDPEHRRESEEKHSGPPPE